MSAYNDGNLKLQPYDQGAVIELAERARQLGVQFKINGIPFGADFDEALWRAHEDQLMDSLKPKAPLTVVK